MGHSRGSWSLGLPEQASGVTVMSRRPANRPPEPVKLHNIAVHAVFDSVAILSWVLGVGLFALAVDVGGRSSIEIATWVILGTVCILGGCYVVYLVGRVHPVSVEKRDSILRIRFIGRPAKVLDTRDGLRVAIERGPLSYVRIAGETTVVDWFLCSNRIADLLDATMAK